MSLLVMSLGGRSCVRCGTGESCWVHPQGENSMAVSG